MNWLDRWLLGQAITRVEHKLEGKGMLSGYKTYIVAVLMGVATALHQLGYIDAQVYETVMGALGAGAVFTIRHAISTTGNGQ
jgi:hypothetical protein